uniref:Dynein regulatory complex subunit 4 n=1 Tax=Knipowitschia caucasica TaxID=637954 RepID=A0AAV2LMM2_KNICA
MLKPVPDNLCPQEQPSPLPGNRIETEEEDEEPFVFVVRGPVPGVAATTSPPQAGITAPTVNDSPPSAMHSVALAGQEPESGGHRRTTRVTAGRHPNPHRLPATLGGAATSRVGGAPRGKRAKTKAPTVVDALSTEEMNKDQLEEHIVPLREELDREREEKSFFQLERDRIQSLWETSLRDLDQVETELNQSRREREEAEERHRMELNQQEKRIQQEVQQVQEEASRRSSELKQEQQRLLMVTEQHYSSLRRRLEQEQKELTDQQQELREELSRVHKKLTTSQKENLRLKEKLEEAQMEVPELRRRLELKEEDKRKEKVIGQKQKVVEQQLRALKTEKTLLQQAFRQVQRERDQLKDSHLELELQLQRRNGLKEALLTHKLRELQTSLNRV